MEELQGHVMVLGHDDGQQKSRANRSIMINDSMFMLWNEERHHFDVRMLPLYEKLDPKSQGRKKMKTGTNPEFMDHLLDVHRSWCKACRPGIDLESRFLHTKKGECMDQETQTLPTMPDIFSCSRCEGTEHMKPMPRLAKIQPSGPQQKISPDIQGMNSNTIGRVRDPLFKGPNIKVIKITKSKGGPLRQEFRMSQQSLKDLMKADSKFGLSLHAAQPVQVALGGSSQLPADCVLPSQNLPTASSQRRPLQLLRVVPVQMSQSSSTSSSLSSGATVISPTPSVPSSSKESIIRDGNITTSSNRGEDDSIADTLSFSDICGSSPVVPLEPAESMDHLEAMPCVGFSQTKCIDEDDNAEDDIYDDGNVKLDDEKEHIDLDTKPMEVKDPLETCIVKEEVLSDTELSNMVHSDKEESLFDQMEDQEVGSDSKPQHSEPEMYEEEEEEEEEYDEEEDDEEIDYEAQELKDPTYEPPSSRRLSKDRKDKPGTSKGMSSTSPGDLDSLGDDEDSLGDDGDSLEYGDDSEDEFEGKRARRAKKHQTRKRASVISQFPGVCPLCSTDWSSSADMTKHMQTHIPIDKGLQAFKEALESIEAKIGKKYTTKIGWCEVCDKFASNLNSHMYSVHKRKTLCTQCGKMMSSSLMKRHELSHIDVDKRDYIKCPHCESRFKHQVYRDEHITKFHINNIQRNFPCSTCGKVFKRRMYLRRHEPIHRDVKPFPCSICDKSFTQKSNLNIHMRQHTGDQPYVCEFCEKAFTNKVSLKNHKKKLHGIDWWKERESLNQDDPETTTQQSD